MATRRISIKSKNSFGEPRTITAQIDTERGDNRVTKSKKLNFLPDSTESLLIRIPKIREQMINREPCSIIVSLSFENKNLRINLVNSGLNQMDYHSAFDSYTNRYPEYPASFTLLSKHVPPGTYGIRTNSDYRGDFLILSRWIKRGEKPLSIVVNLSSIFMFDSSMEIMSSGKFVYLNTIVCEHPIPVGGSKLLPFLFILENGDDLKIEKFKQESWELIHEWVPYMNDIQRVDVLRSNGRDGVEDASRSASSMKKYLKKLIVP
ncbi:MAG: hypothetical protein US50_C0019G0017 [Candidatus Nomurabacteria bacterium GW2011_GWB1_37_5]|uniref:Uncharacterized protein n=1 Tax=Candidatus Nomurabacteria bacterium GW2011_GWB1_37_5 TaxID=1618742 RepID=A0A0G0H9T5_9BACT|nr:MAG: hypothetical protein US50_C0019G0017 [Candidatus Nomurabacteria bacterium GW2011_GWB1_37_5]